MTKEQKRIVKAIHTANGWSSDQASGINLLSLGTTRIIHSESHRQGCIDQIGRDIAWNRTYTPSGPDDVNQPTRDIPALEDLLDLVRHAKVGQEWISFEENNRLNDALCRRGELF